MMDTNTSYEIKAEAFRIMTGHMPPGKDASVATYSADIEIRSALWDMWTNQHAAIMYSMITAFERIVEDNE